MLIGVVDADRNVLHTERRASAGLSTDELLDELADGLRVAREAHPEARGVGLGIPCRIDRERGLAIGAVNLPIENVPIRDLMAERSGLPVFVDNDANVAALAEHRYGAARGTTNAVLLTIGTGIGGGLILGGRVYRGSTGAGAELGHLVVDMDGPRCQGSCPNHGCIEAVASGTALGREGRAAAEAHPDSELGRLRAAGEEITGASVTKAAVAGDAVAREVFDTIGTRLGVALSSLANVFEPDVFVIGGGVMAAGDLLLDPARAELRKRALTPMNETPVVPAELGPDAGMIGAATMALDEIAESG
jgi:glucokinase